jgi:nucleoside-diphosphate-sugar epimerase
VATIALTGGTGFVGQRLIPLLLAQGYDVRALTRQQQPTIEHLNWVKGDLSNLTALQTLCTDCDTVIHLAGVIKAVSAADFDLGNVDGTTNMLRAASELGMRRFLHVSSLAARQPHLSDYCRSKAESEELVKSSGLDWTILRPPGVYGPGDRETLALFKAATGPLLPIAAGKQRMSWIYVDDLCAAIIAALAPSLRHEVIEVDDDAGGYTQRQFAIAIAKSVKGSPAIIALPKFIVLVAGAINHLIAKYQGRAAMLTPGKAREIFHRDWVVADRTLTRLTGWHPHVTLEIGLKKTAGWFKTQKWL